MELNIVLVEPQIPQNTGNIARTCAVTGARLHIVKPMGFQIDDKKLKHAGLDYWHYLDITYYDGLDDFFERNKDGEFFYFTTKGRNTYCDAEYKDKTYIVFGREDKGLPRASELRFTYKIRLEQSRIKQTNRKENKTMKVKLITDSASDITPEDEKKYGIDIMPFDITLGDESLRERVDFTAPEFLEMIDKSEFLPKTAQITSMRFEEKFEHYFNEGYDAVIMVLINSTGSKTYENALLARKNLLEEHPEMAKMRIEIIDSHCYSLGYGYPVIEAAKKLIAGQSVDNVVAYLTDMFNNCEIYIIGFNLRHMKKSGRINAAAAFLGELMGLKPLISLIDGESEVVKKSRGEKNAITDAVQYISGRAVPETPWEILRTSVTALEDEFIKQYSAKVGRPPEMQSIAGAAVASNTGPYIIGVIIRGNARR